MTARRRPRPRVTAAAFGVLALAAVLYLHALPPGLFTSPFAARLDFEYPNYAVQDRHGGRYVVDTALRRVVKLNAHGAMEYRIEGGSREEGRFFYANEIAADDQGRLYVLNYVNDHRGFYLDREEILRYTPEGRYDGVVYRRVFGEADRIPELVQRGEIFSLEVEGDELHWLRVTGDGLRAYRYRMKAGDVQEGPFYPLPRANTRIGDVSRAGPQALVYSDKTGRVVRVQADGGNAVLYETHDASHEGAVRVVPWEVGTDAEGRVYFVDLEGRSIRMIDSPRAAPVVLDRGRIEAVRGEPTRTFNYYRLSVTPDGGLVTCNDEALVVWDGDGRLEYLTGAWIPWSWRLQVASAWLVAAVLAGLALRFAWAAYLKVVGPVVPPLLLRGLGVVGVVAVTGIVSTHTAIERFSARYQEAVVNNIAGIISLVPAAIDVRHFREVREQGDFGNAAYEHLRSNLLRVFAGQLESWSAGYYFVLYRVLDGRLYGFMFMNGRIGVLHPYDWLGTGRVYDRALAGEVATEVSTDIAGDWIFGVGPLRDEQGRVVALIETGTDLYTFRVENARLVRELAVRLATLLIVLALVLVEVAFVAGVLRRGPATGVAGVPAGDMSDVVLARPLAFLFFAAVSVSVAFVPLMMKDFYAPIPGLSREVVLALPVSLEMLGFGLASVLGGALAGRRGWKPVFYLGTAGAAGGLLLSAGANGMVAFGVARALTGVGSGLVFMALRVLVNREGQGPVRSEGYTHFYSGMTGGIAAGTVLGGTLSEVIGYAQVFLMAFGLTLLALVFQLVFVRDPPHPQRPERDGRQRVSPVSAWAATRLFLTDPRNVAFFLLIVLPTYIAAAFIVYYFPLFAEAQGLSTGAIGLTIILGSMCVIYLGPALSAYLERTVGMYRSMILGSLLWGTSLLIFALMGTAPWAVAAIVAMGVAEGFCAAAQNELFLGSPVVSRLGADRSVGYFELMGSVGETIGPMAFALAMAVGPLLGPAAIGAAVIAAALLYTVSVGDGGRGETPRPGVGTPPVAQP